MSANAKRKPTTAELKSRTPLGGAPIPPKVTVPTVVPKSTVAIVKPAEDNVSRYLDEVAPASIVGRMIKFSKDGKFVTHDDGGEVSEDQDFIALCDETLVGYVKFNGTGEPPDRHMGLLYDNFIMPDRKTLGDLDESTWELGLDGEPSDPFQHHMYLVLQQADTRELFTFVTSSPSGRRAVGNLLKHYERLRRSNADDVPVVRLRPGGFKHKDSRVGWVPTPVFVVFGKMPRDSAAKPGTSTDEIPF